MDYRCFKAASGNSINFGAGDVRSSSPLDGAVPQHIKNDFDGMHLRDFAGGTSCTPKDYEPSKYDLDYDGEARQYEYEDEYDDGGFENYARLSEQCAKDERRRSIFRTAGAAALSAAVTALVFSLSHMRKRGRNE